MAKKKQPKKSLLGSLKNLLGGPPSDARYAKSFAKSRKRAKSGGPRRDLLAPFQLPILDLDLLVHPAKDSKPRIPPKLNIGTLLVSQRHGVKCILIDPLEKVEITAVAFDHRSDKVSTLIGPQDKPADGDIGASGEPLGDLLALINNELGKERMVFVLDGTLFFLGKRLYRVNEELAFRPQHISKLELLDLEALEAEWKIHPYVEEGADEEEELPAQ